MAVEPQKMTHIGDQLHGYTPVRILEIELGQPLPKLLAFDEKKERYYQRASCLIRLHSQPLGLVELTINKEILAPEEYAPVIWQALRTQINEHLQKDGLPTITMLTINGLAGFITARCIEERERFLADAPFVSIIIPTHDRPEQLEACLRSLISLSYPQYEIIVVDNAPSTSTTADIVGLLSQTVSYIRYVREDRTGPSWARNRGIMIARGSILAFTDDDVVVDPYWLANLVRGFGVAEDVACVTGLVLPMELETPAQFLFEAYCGFTRGFTQRIFDLKENHPNLPLHPYIAGRFGTGASMAFTASFIRSVGGFDPALGGAGPVRCSQDIAAFFQVLTHGDRLVYEPSSLLYHLHRRDYIHLQKQIYNYSVGFPAYLTKSLVDNPPLVFDFIRKLPYAFFYLLRSQLLKQSKGAVFYPRELRIIEWKGRLYGTFAYLQSRRALSHIRKESLKESPVAEDFSSSSVKGESDFLKSTKLKIR